MSNPNLEAQRATERKAEQADKDKKPNFMKVAELQRELDKLLPQVTKPEDKDRFFTLAQNADQEAGRGLQNLEQANRVEQGGNKGKLDSLTDNARVQSLRERGRLDPKLQEQLPEIQQKLQANLEKAKGILAGKTELTPEEARQIIDATVGEKNGLHGEAAKIYRGQFCEELNRMLADSPNLAREQKSDILVNTMAEQPCPHDSIKSSLWKSMRAAEKDLPLGTPADRQKIEDLMTKGETMPFSQPLKIGGKEFIVKNAKVLIGGQMVNLDPKNMLTFEIKDVALLPDGRAVARMENGCRSNFMILEPGEPKFQKAEQPQKPQEQLFPQNYKPLDGQAVKPQASVNPLKVENLYPDQPMQGGAGQPKQENLYPDQPMQGGAGTAEQPKAGPREGYRGPNQGPGAIPPKLNFQKEKDTVALDKLHGNLRDRLNAALHESFGKDQKLEDDITNLMGEIAKKAGQKPLSMEDFDEFDKRVGDLEKRANQLKQPESQENGDFWPMHNRLAKITQKTLDPKDKPLNDAAQKLLGELWENFKQKKPIQPDFIKKVQDLEQQLQDARKNQPEDKTTLPDFPAGLGKQPDSTRTVPVGQPGQPEAARGAPPQQYGLDLNEPGPNTLTESSRWTTDFLKQTKIKAGKVNDALSAGNLIKESVKQFAENYNTKGEKIKVPYINEMDTQRTSADRQQLTQAAKELLKIINNLKQKFGGNIANQDQTQLINLYQKLSEASKQPDPSKQPKDPFVPNGLGGGSITPAGGFLHPNW
ncbi:MAG: hypothetical protein V2A63_00620 [Patescibacteria group bacterium]